MKHILLLILCLTPCLASVGGAIYLAANHVAGWGWFVFLAICLGTVSVSTK